MKKIARLLGVFRAGPLSALVIGLVFAPVSASATAHLDPGRIKVAIVIFNEVEVITIRVR